MTHFYSGQQAPAREHLETGLSLGGSRRAGSHERDRPRPGCSPSAARHARQRAAERCLRAQGFETPDLRGARALMDKLAAPLRAIPS